MTLASTRCKRAAPFRLTPSRASRTRTRYLSRRYAGHWSLQPTYPANHEFYDTMAVGVATNLEKRLCLALLFVSQVLLNVTPRLSVWPRIEHAIRPYAPLAVAVCLTRVPGAVLAVQFYQRISGGAWVGEPLATAAVFLPTVLVDLALGSCCVSCDSSRLVACR
jgi:hypothetical protein